MTSQPWRQGYVPRYGCGTFVLLWIYSAAINVLLVWLEQWPSWSAGFAATAAGACFGSAVLAAFNSRDRYRWDQVDAKRERRPMFDGDEDEPKSYSCEGCAGPGRCDGTCHLR